MRITKIEQQKKNKERYSVFLDDKFAFGMSGTDILYFKLREGNELTRERYDYILEYIVFEEAKKKAFNYISAGYKTEKEVRDKLFSKQFSEEIIEKTILLLKNYAYVDDSVYTKKFIEYRTNIKKQGKIKIKYDLKNKGVPEEIINEFLNNDDRDNSDTIVGLIEKKAKGNRHPDQKEKQKIYGFLVRRGFQYNEINEAFRKYLES